MKQYPNRPRGGILASYVVVGLLSLALDVVRTRLTFPGRRLMRRPLYIRGRRWIVLGRGGIIGAVFGRLGFHRLEYLRCAIRSATYPQLLWPYLKHRNVH
jgi:hypothetical protein